MDQPPPASNANWQTDHIKLHQAARSSRRAHQWGCRGLCAFSSNSDLTRAEATHGCSTKNTKNRGNKRKKRKRNGNEWKKGLTTYTGPSKLRSRGTAQKQGTPSPQTAIPTPAFHMVVGRECRVRSCQKRRMDTICDGESMQLPKQKKLLSKGAKNTQGRRQHPVTSTTSTRRFFLGARSWGGTLNRERQMFGKRKQRDNEWIKH